MRREQNGSAFGRVLASCLAIGAGWFVAEPAHVPLWPAYAFAGVGMVGCYWLAAEFWRLPPFKPIVDLVTDEHAEQIRGVAQSLANRFRQEELPEYPASERDSGLWKSVFSAHFPAIDNQINSFIDQTLLRTAANRDFRLLVQRSLAEKFKNGDGWDLNEMRSILNSRRESLLFGKQPEVDEDFPQKCVRWDGSIVYRAERTEPGPELFHLLTSSTLALDQWVHALVDSESPAAAYRKASQAREEAKSAALSGLEPIIHSCPIQVAKGCPICAPERGASSS